MVRFLEWEDLLGREEEEELEERVSDELRSILEEREEEEGMTEGKRTMARAWLK